jgi:hypothetical protein
MADHLATSERDVVAALQRALRDEPIELAECLCTIATWWTSVACGPRMPRDCHEDTLRLSEALQRMVFAIRCSPAEVQTDEADTGAAGTDEAEAAEAEVNEVEVSADPEQPDRIPEEQAETGPDPADFGPDQDPACQESDCGQVAGGEEIGGDAAGESISAATGYAARTATGTASALVSRSVSNGGAVSLKQRLAKICEDTEASDGPYLSPYGKMVNLDLGSQWRTLSLIGLRLRSDNQLNVALKGLRENPEFGDAWEGVEGRRTPAPVPDRTALDLLEPLSGENDKFIRNTLQEMCWIVEHDDGLKIAVEQLTSRHPYRAVDRNLREQYKLTARGRYNNHHGPNGAEAWTLTELDELVRGVLPFPLPQRDSWWDRTLGRLYGMLAKISPQADTGQIIGEPYEPGQLGLWDKSGQVAVPSKKLSEIAPTDRRRPRIGETLWVLRYPCDTTGSGRKPGRIMYVS